VSNRGVLGTSKAKGLGIIKARIKKRETENEKLDWNRAHFGTGRLAFPDFRRD